MRNESNSVALMQTRESVALEAVKELKHLEAAKDGLSLSDFMEKFQKKDELRDLAYLRIGACKLDEAIDILKKAVRIDPASSDFYSLLAMLYLDKNNPAPVFSIISHLKKYHPNSDTLYSVVADLFKYQKQYDKSIAICGHLLSTDMSCHNYCALANVYMRKGDYDNTYECFQKTAELNPFCKCAKEFMVTYLKNKHRETGKESYLDQSVSMLHSLLKYYPVSTYRMLPSFAEYAPYYNYYKTTNQLGTEIPGLGEAVDDLLISLIGDISPRDKYEYFYISYISKYEFRKMGWVTQKCVEESGKVEDYLLGHIVYRGGAEDRHASPQERMRYSKLSEMYLEKAREMEPENPLLKLYE